MKAEPWTIGTNPFSRNVTREENDLDAETKVRNVQMRRKDSEGVDENDITLLFIITYSSDNMAICIPGRPITSEKQIII